MLAMRDLTMLKAAGQQRLAALVTDIREVLARHKDARGSGLLQTIHKVPFLCHHQILLASSSYVLLLVRGDWSRGKSEDSVAREVLPSVHQGTDGLALSTIHRIIGEQEMMA